MYVLDGELLFLFGARQISVPPGTFVFIPRGTLHAAKVVGIEPGKMLAEYITVGLERSFEEFAHARTEKKRVGARLHTPQTGCLDS